MSALRDDECDCPWGAPIPSYDEAAARASLERWNGIAKPLGCLGELEKAVIKISGLVGNHRHAIANRVVLVMCADNGVVGRGVTQTGSEVTAVLARNLVNGEISVCKMAEVAGARVVPVDMGVNTDLRLDGLLNRRIAAGTGDIAAGPAMSRNQAIQAIGVGMDLVGEMRRQGCDIILTGEVGIGNTTTSSAVASVLLRQEPAIVTGRGAGLSSEGLRNKIAVIEQAIRVNRPDPADPLDVLAKVGGFDIAGLVGVFLGGAYHRVPVLVDGLISSVAALVAQRLRPESADAMLASHVSAEPACRMLLDALGLSPLICAGMCLGEGSGAVAALPLLDMAYAVYNGMPTFEDIAIERYQPLA